MGGTAKKTELGAKGQKIQFSLRRMIAATSVFAAVLGLAKFAALNMIGAVVAASAMAAITVILDKKHATHFLYSVVFAGIGLVVSVFVMPVQDMGTQESASSHRLYAAIIAAVAGWILGGVAVRIDDRIKAAREAKEKTAGKER